MTDGDAPAVRLALALRDSVGLRPDRTVEAVRRLLDDAPAELITTRWATLLSSGRLDDADLDDLVTAVTVPESYFFRDRPQVDWLRDDWIPEFAADRRAKGTRRIRVWSAGCCAGQELYTMAILLTEGLDDLDDWDVRLLGTDISRESLAQARAGVYTSTCLRGRPVANADRWFHDGPLNTVRLDPQIVAMASFERLNLAARNHADVVADYGNYDLVFCRNVLMYLTLECTRNVVESLVRSLAPGGIVVLGATDFPAAEMLRVAGLEHVRASVFRRPPYPWRADDAVFEIPARHARRQDSPRGPAVAPRVTPTPRPEPRAVAPVAPVAPVVSVAPPRSPQESSPLASGTPVVPTDAWALWSALANATQSETLAMISDAALDDRDLIAELLAAEQWSAAIELVHLTVAFIGRDPWLLLQMGRALLGLGDPTGALAHARSAAALHPRSSDAHFLAGMAALALGRTETGDASLVRTLVLEPRHSPARVALALLREGKPALREALRLNALIRGWKRPD